MRTLVRWSNSSRKNTTLSPRQGEPSRCMLRSLLAVLVLEIAVVDRVEARLLDRQPPQRAAGIDHGGGGLRRARRARPAAGSGSGRPDRPPARPASSDELLRQPLAVGLDLDVIAAAEHLAAPAPARVPISAMRPALNSATRSHTLCTRSSRCDDSSTATPSCLSERIVSSSSAVACGSRPEVGSSRIAIGDVLHQDFGKAEPLAHAARERADPLVGRRRRGRRGRAPPRSRLSRSAGSIPIRRRGVAQIVARPSCGRRSRRCRADSRPRRLTCSGSRTGSWPSTLTLPAVTSVRPSIIRMVVVLPAPFGPSRPKISPRPTVNEMPSTAATLP